MKRSQGGNSSKKQQQMVAQIIQAYAQLTQEDPRRIMQQLQGLPPDQQQKSLENMYKAIQLTQQQGQASQQPQGGYPQQQMAAPQAQQQMSPEQAQMLQQQQMSGGMDQSQMGDQSQMAMYGGGYRHGGSTYSGGVWFADGGYIPEYNYAYGGYHSEIPKLFNQPVDRPNKAMYGMGMAEGGQMPQWLAERRFAAAGNLDRMGDYGYADGGVVVGQVMDADPELLQKLDQGGYTYKIIG